MIFIRLLSTFFAVSLIGCSSISLNDVMNLSKLFTNTDLDQKSLYESNENSYLILKLGDFNEITMVLADINDGIFKWVSADFDEIYTLRGRIIAINGFDIYYKTDLTNKPTSKFKEVILFKSSFRNPDLYFTPTILKPKKLVRKEMLYLEEDIEVIEYVESVHIKEIYWHSKNKFIFDLNNRPIQSTQKISPLHPSFKLTFFYK